MANDCGIITENGLTEDPNQVSTLWRRGDRTALISGFLVAVQLLLQLGRECPMQRRQGSRNVRSPLCYFVVQSVIHRPVSAIDTGGNKWNCSPTSDTSCNKNSPIEFFVVVACCDRA